MKLTEIKQSIKSLGLNNYLLYAVNRLLNKTTFNKIRIIKYYFYAQPVNLSSIIKNPEKRKIKVRQILPDDPIVCQFPRPEYVIKERYYQNAHCFSAIKAENEFVGYIWFCENEYHEDEVRCKFIPWPKNEAVWDFDVYIKPESRLSLAFPLLWDRVNESLRGNHYQWSLSRISAFNPVSLSVHKKLGARYVGKAIFFCIGPLQILLSSLRPYFSISVHSVPKLRVNAPIN